MYDDYSEEYYEPQDYSPYEDRSSSFFTVMTNILLFLLLFEIIFFAVGALNTTFRNNAPQILSIEKRREEKYMNMVNHFINDLQNVDNQIEQIFELYSKQQSISVPYADQEISGALLKIQVMLENLTAMDVPQRFNHFDNLLRFIITTKQEATSSYLNYLRSFNESQLEEYRTKRDQYRAAMLEATDTWMRLIEKSETPLPY
ncbi:MAG: hypothetical protein ACOCQR_03785 [bacterium]